MNGSYEQLKHKPYFRKIMKTVTKSNSKYIGYDSS